MSVDKITHGQSAQIAQLDTEGKEGIAKVGHRGYVGGMWEEIGVLQFEFLLLKGMIPSSYLLDIACGPFRLGVKAIPFLERSHYLGIEKETELVKAGLEIELESGLRVEKRPKIVISNAFEFEKFGHKANFAIAQSLFTHMPPNLINQCFNKLHPWLEDDGVFYATFFETGRKIRNPEKPHDHGYFAYTRDEMCGFGLTNGFTANYIGDWNHPRNQKIVEFQKR